MKIKFLIIRFSSIGDIVLTTPVIRCLKLQIVGAEIHFVTKKQYHSIISQNPYIDKVHLLEDNLNDLVRELKKEKFDYIIDLHHNLRSSIIKTRLKTLAFSFNKLNFQKWLMVNFKKNFLPEKHIVDRYFYAIAPFDVKNDLKGLDFFIEQKNEVDISSLPLNFHKGYVALAIGAKHFTKQMPEDKLIQLCNGIDIPIILMGGPEDRFKAERIIQFSEKAKIFNACGGFNLQQSASLIRQAKLVITPDTGLMHIAAAYKQKIISIWGNTIPQFGMYTYLPDHKYYTFEVNGLKCRPCSKLGFQKCPKKHFDCMNKQNISGIIELCNILLLNK
jgi:ADP-heptose:LPS heptosyltransferase